MSNKASRTREPAAAATMTRTRLRPSTGTIDTTATIDAHHHRKELSPVSDSSHRASTDPGHPDPRRRHRPRVRRPRHAGSSRRPAHPIDWEDAEAGAEVFKKGIASGVPQETMDSIARTRVALKGPLETPVGFGEKSANVTLRKLFETYANVRPVREMPGVTTPYSGRGIDLVIVRENVEDLYAGIEYMQTPGRRPGAEADQREGLREDRAVRVRVRAQRGPHAASRAPPRPTS